MGQAASSSSAAAGEPMTGQASPSVDVRHVGLVSQWDDKYYGLALPDPFSAGELLLTPGVLWSAAENDAAAAGETPKDYLARVLDRSLDFFDAKEDADGLPRVVNHEGTLAALRSLGRREGKGQLLLLTGPRSVGKSLMLQKIAKELAGQKRRVLYIDARQYGSDLPRGIIASLAEDPEFFEKAVDSAAEPTAVLILKLVSEVVRSGSSKIITALQERYKKSTSAGVAVSPSARLDVVLGAFFTACKASEVYPVIFIDEANKAFKAATGEAEATARVADVLDLFTRITKQQKEASIVMATSEHGLPFRLRELGYTTDHISKTIVAEEVPPAVMKDELMRRWECGEHLATALLSMYGGHILHASAAVRELATFAAPESMEGIVAVGSVASAPALCLDDDTLRAAGVPSAAWPEMRTRVMDGLRALAEVGFVSLDSEKDKVAEVISLANAGCVIPRMGTSSGVLPAAWNTVTASGKVPKHILVPPSHMMRLLIASEVFPRPRQA